MPERIVGRIGVERRPIVRDEPHLEAGGLVLHDLEAAHAFYELDHAPQGSGSGRSCRRAGGG